MNWGALLAILGIVFGLVLYAAVASWVYWIGVPWYDRKFGTYIENDYDDGQGLLAVFWLPILVFAPIWLLFVAAIKGPHAYAERARRRREQPRPVTNAPAYMDAADVPRVYNGEFEN